MTKPAPPLPFSAAAHKRAVLVALLAVLGFGAAFAWQWVSYRARTAELAASARSLGEERASKISAELDDVLARVEAATRRFAKELESGAIGTDTLLARLEKDSYSEPFLLGLTVAYAVDAYPGGDKRLYAPFFDVGHKKMLFCEDYYDYTDPARRLDAQWYQDALESFERGLWVAAFGPAAGTTYVGYSVPFRDAGGRTAGIVNASVSMDKLGHLLGKRFIGRLGGGVLIDARGMLIAHPIQEYVRAGKLARDVAAEQDDAVLAAFADGDAPGAERRFSAIPSFRVEGAGAFFEREIQRNGWRLGVAILESELPGASDELRRRRIALLWLGLLGASFLLALVLRVDRLRDVGMWIFVALFTLLCLAGVACIWTTSSAEATRGDRDREGIQVVEDASSLAAFVERQKERAAEIPGAPAPVFVETGLELQSLRFVDGESVQVGGIVWQNYDDEAHAGLERAVRFANLAPDPEGSSLEEISRSKSGGRERIVWEFRTVLRVPFDFRLYPFDRQRIPVALAHPAVDRDVVLTPDLGSYAVLSSSAKPGVAELVLPGWSIRGSHFAYETRRTTVGLGALSGRSEFSRLQFAVLAQRQVLSPFLSYLVPLLIVLALLHGVLISSSFNSDKKSNSGFSTFGVLETSGAFFFAIVFLHIDLRGALSLDTITYLEALYIVAYSMLILVAVNSLVFTETDAIPVLEYRDNLMAKLLYWPIVTALCFVVTSWMFW